MKNCTVVEMFAGVGGLTHGFILEGFSVVAGYDIDEHCKYPYETNNPGAKFYPKKIEETTAQELSALYPEGHIKILIGCAPCQPYSKYTNGNSPGEKWKLIEKYADLICAVKPDIVSMENVPDLKGFNDGKVYGDFVKNLEKAGYHISEYPRVFCPNYGIPQSRTRLVFFASLFGKIELEEPTYTPDKYKTVKNAIGELDPKLDPIEAGGVSKTDPIHRASGLYPINLKRIRASKPGGTWHDWPEELVAKCHTKESGSSYEGVYGRMSWDEPSPTITTQCNGYGNGRFGHPEQDRAISLREAALLQTFPRNYKFVEPEKPVYIEVVARLIGNAVPVELGRVIARSIKAHIESFGVIQSEAGTTNA